MKVQGGFKKWFRKWFREVYFITLMLIPISAIVPFTYMRIVKGTEILDCIIGYLVTCFLGLLIINVIAATIAVIIEDIYLKFKSKG